MTFSIDNSELSKLAAALGQISETAGQYVRTAVETTARYVKDDWADKLQGEPRVPHGSRSITYDIIAYSDLIARGSVIQADIGAERGRLQAPIVTVLEYGAPGNNLAPRGYGHGALKENEPDFQRGLVKALEDAERVLDSGSSVLKNARAVIRGSVR